MNKTSVALLRWLIALTIPIVILGVVTRVMWQPWLAYYEYGKPDFPPDPYGFTTEQRLEYTLGWIRFFNSAATPEVAIAEQAAVRAPDGKLLYDGSALSHMVDVKRVTDGVLRILIVAALVLAVALMGLLARPATRWDAYAALFIGGLLTAGLLIFLILFMLVAWQSFFVAFHDVLFPPGTWTFDYSNALIRLFPDRFWFDVFTLAVGAALAVGMIVTVAGFLLGRRARKRLA